MARSATSLGPKPSLFVFFSCFFFVFFCFLVPFLSLIFIENTVFPLKRAFFVFFHCLPFFLHSLFWPPPFSLFLSLSLSFSSISFFLLVFLFAFFCFLAFVSFFLLVYSLLLFHEKNNIKIFNYKSFCSSILSHFCWFPLFFFLSNPLSLSLLFVLILSFVFCSTSVFFFKKCKFKKHHFSKNKGLQNNGYFLMNLCFAKCEKLSFLGGHVFLSFLVACQKSL